jgi:hypothetical protein
VILCDMDGVLAMGPRGDTAPREFIYRTFVEYPTALRRIREAGIPVHLVTAKVEAEARQVLRAIELEGDFTSIIGADQLFWPTLRSALRRRRLPAAIAKSTFRSVLEVPPGRPVVMIEDNRGNLLEMLGEGAIDFGILVPPLRMEGERLARGFDLELAFSVARRLSDPRLDPATLAEDDIPLLRSHGGYLLHLPELRDVGGAPPLPDLKALTTGVVLQASGADVVSAIRAGRRLVRNLLVRGRRG